MDKPGKKGVLDKTNSGQPMLINTKGECYSVTKAIASVWDNLDGTKTVKEIAQDITKTNSINPRNLETAIDEIVSKLKEYDLAE